MRPAVRITTTRPPATRNAKDELADLHRRVDRAEAKLDRLRSRIPLDGSDYLRERARLRNAVLDAESDYNLRRARDAARELAALEGEFHRRSTVDLTPQPEPVVLFVDERFGDVLLEYRGGQRHGDRLWVRASDGEPLTMADIEERRAAWFAVHRTGAPAGPFPQFPSTY
jgi:hypothetical protein